MFEAHIVYIHALKFDANINSNYVTKVKQNCL